MFSRAFQLIIGLGMLITLSATYFTLTLTPTVSSWTCQGQPYEINAEVSGGLPFKSSYKTTVYGSCGEIISNPTLHDYIGVVWSLKSFTNFVFWVVCLDGLFIFLYLIKSFDIISKK